MKKSIRSVLSELEKSLKEGKLTVDSAEETQIALDKTIADSKKRIAAAKEKRESGPR